MMIESKVPGIRFSDFTDEWHEYSMGELYKERKEPGNDSLPILSVSIHSGISDGELDEENLGKHVRRIEDKSAYKHAHAGDLVFNMMRAWQGAIGSAPSEGMVSPAYITAEPCERVYPPFMDYYVKRKETVEQINSLSYGVTDFRKRLYWDSFVQVKCKLPTLNEQKAIAAELTHIDEMISTTERNLDKWKELKKGMLQKMFPKEGESVPEIRFPGFEGQWKRYKLEEVTDEFRSGTFIAATDIVDDGEYPVYGGNGLRGYANTFNHDGEFALIGRQGALCGNVNYSYGKAYFTEHAVAVKANSSANTKFLFYLLDLMKLGQYSDQSAQPGLAVGKLIKLENMFPSKQEQERISNLFSLLDMIISNLQGEVMKWQTLKKALLQQMFV